MAQFTVNLDLKMFKIIKLNSDFKSRPTTFLYI